MAKSDKKDEPKTISVASRVHTSVHIVEPPEDPDRPGLTPEGQSLILHGASHPMARNGEMVNHEVDAKIFRRWHEHQKSVRAPIADMVYEVAPDHQDTAGTPSFGFEPALSVMADQADASSTVTHAAPLEAPEMAATSDTPDDSSPRSQTDAYPVKRSQKSASQTIADELGGKK